MTSAVVVWAGDEGRYHTVYAQRVHTGEGVAGAGHAEVWKVGWAHQNADGTVWTIFDKDRRVILAQAQYLSEACRVVAEQLETDRKGN